MAGNPTAKDARCYWEPKHVCLSAVLLQCWSWSPLSHRGSALRGSYAMPIPDFYSFIVSLGYILFFFFFWKRKDQGLHLTK